MFSPTTMKPSQSWSVCVLPMFLALIVSNNAIAAKLSKKDLIQVQVTGPDGKGQAATGFLWKENNHVVTSLHAVLHSRIQGSEINVFCNGNKTKAKVVKVYKKADLVLLEAADSIEGCTIFEGSFPACGQADKLKPAPGTKLFTAGWKGAAQSATGRNLVKGDVLVGDPETIAGLATDKKTLDAIKSLQLPSIHLDIYFVGGDGLGGGYSGAPVLDEQRNLLGVVDGGMNKGAGDYNWLVPALNLNCLSDSQENKVPQVDLSKLTAHFSAGIVDPGGQTEISFTPRPTQQQGGSKYHFVKTKTSLLRDIINTADESIADGIEEILLTHETEGTANAANELSFDFFEDTDRNLIIAVPAGQALVDGPLDNYPDIHGLRSEDINNNGFITFKEIVPDNEGFQVVAVAKDGEKYYPNQDGYFDAFIEQEISNCEIFGSVCSVHDESVWQENFGNGNKVVTFGINRAAKESSIAFYQYYNVTVRDNIAFSVKVELPLWESGNLIKCSSSGASCTEKSTLLSQLSQLVAANLTTFSND